MLTTLCRSLLASLPAVVTAVVEKVTEEIVTILSSLCRIRWLTGSVVLRLTRLSGCSRAVPVAPTSICGIDGLLG